MAKIQRGNLFTNLPKTKSREVFRALFKNKRLKIERIVSAGQATKEGVWLRQRRSEWVILLQGNARLRFWKKRELVGLKAGEYVFIPKDMKHRVEWTTPRRKSVWLALHF